MANTIVKGSYVQYNGTALDRFSNRIVDDIDGSGISPLDNFISPLKKEMIWKNDNIQSKVTVDFINVDNGWYYADKNRIMSIIKVNR